MMKKILLSGLSALLFTSTQTLSGQWSTNGPNGGSMTSLTKNSSGIYAGTMANGVFRSSDQGLTWTAANKGLERIWINDLASNTGGVFAATAYKGVYYTNDNGNNWFPLNNGITDLHITTIFASGNDVFAGTPDGVFHSANNGVSWALSNSGIPSTYTIYDWAQMGDTIYGATYGQGLYMTNNKGQSWSQVGGGFPTTTPWTTFYVYSLATSGNTIYAGTSAGIYLSADRGASWAHSGNMFMSSNYARELAVVGSSLYAGTYAEGIFISSDNAASFVSANNGIQSFPVFPYYIEASDFIASGNTVIAATLFGMYRTTNNGLNWADNNEGIHANDITGVASTGSAVFAGAEWTGMYVSTNKGASWTRANNGLQANFIRCVATSGTDAFASVTNKKVSRSSDNGQSWQWASNGLPADPVLLEADTDRVLAVTSASKYTPEKLYQTTDKGSNWTEVPTTSMGGGFSAVEVRHPYIYLGTGNGILLRSSNGGQSWGDISHYLPNVKVTAILSLDTVTYVGTEGKGIFMLRNNDTWMMTANNGLSNYNITDIIKQDGILLVSTNGGGIFASANGGMNWFAVNGGLDNLSVKKMTGQSLMAYAATSTGVYHTDHDAFNKITILSGVNDAASQDDIKLFPNPSSGLIFYRSENSGVIAVTVYDVNGRLIFSNKASTSFMGEIDLSSNQKGIYLMKISTEKGTSMKRILIQ